MGSAVGEAFEPQAVVHFAKNSTFLRKPSSPSAGPYGHGILAPAKPIFLTRSGRAVVQ